MATFTEDDMLHLGFRLRKYQGYTSVKADGQIILFKSLYGPSPKVLATLWSMLVHNEQDDDFKFAPAHLLIWFRFKRSYETEKELSTQFDMGEETLRKVIKLMAEKMSALRKHVVCIITHSLHFQTITMTFLTLPFID